MAYVIKNKINGRYVNAVDNKWENISKATKFKTMDRVNNYMQKNFAGSFLFIPKEDVDILEYPEQTMKHAVEEPRYDIIPLSDAEADIEMNNLLELMNSMQKQANMIDSLSEYYTDAKKQVWKEEVDILHKIEFSDVNAASGYKLYKQLQDVLRKRRTVKDNLAILNAISGGGYMSCVDRYSLAIDKINNREYNPRALPELFEEV